MRAKKAYGQHFLIDSRALEQIAELTWRRPEGGSPTAMAYEVGPGTGNLTAALLKHPAAAPLIAVERDPEMIEALRRRFPSHAFDLIHDSAEGFNFSADASTRIGVAAANTPPNCVVVGNLPYYVATAIHFNILQARSRVRRAVLMFQREVAERLVASPGSRAYGAPTVATALWATARIAFHLPPTSFSPPPKVESSVVVVELSAVPYFDIGPRPEGFQAFLAQLFSARRKTILNGLKAAGISQDAAASGLQLLELAPQMRAETVAPAQLGALYAHLSRTLHDDVCPGRQTHNRGNSHA